jgi:hypothetical protein
MLKMLLRGVFFDTLLTGCCGVPDYLGAALLFSRLEAEGQELDVEFGSQQS